MIYLWGDGKLTKLEKGSTGIVTLTKKEEALIDRWLDSILIDPVTKPIVRVTGQILIELLITDRLAKAKGVHK